MLEGQVYRQIDGQELLLDLYLPPRRDRKYPAVLFVHGGGFVQGHRRMMGVATEFPALLAGLAAKGFVVASIEYRLAPGARFPAQVRDAGAAAVWLRENAERFAIDPGRIGVWGSSAGGTIASTLALGCQNGLFAPDGDNSVPPGANCVQAAADWFGPTTIEPGFLTRAYLGCATTAECGVERLAAASPMAYVARGSPPFQIIHGADDATVPTSHSQQLAEALRSAGADVDYQVMAGAGHGLRATNPADQARILDEAMASLTAFFQRTIGFRAGATDQKAPGH